MIAVDFLPQRPAEAKKIRAHSDEADVTNSIDRPYSVQ
jgi:hypothetical protein